MAPPPTPSLGGLSPTLSTADTITGPTDECETCMAFPKDYPANSNGNLQKPCHGWPQLAQVMVKEELHDFEWKDHRKGGRVPSRLCANVGKMFHEVQGKDQFDKMKEIREVLKDYNAALLQYSQVNEFPQAEDFNVTSFRTLLKELNGTKLDITGPGQKSWGDISDKNDMDSKTLWRQFGGVLRSILWEEKSNTVHVDLVVPRKDKDIDPLTRWVKIHGMPFWHNVLEAYHEAEDSAKNKRRWTSWIFLLIFFGLNKEPVELPTPNARADGKKRSPSITSSVNITYSLQRMIRFTNFVATIVACLLPIIAIVVLAKLHTQAKILGFIALFTAVFAVGIMWLTGSSTSRTEIFTATAA
ncbi:uncharacterized protein PAC_03335 [Phialocephala subalpina]|uniref:DUF6594 domain-containing protein n=1 Tax=Phialocephala subalpina TaxID=576137 RepID=A0A1L7WL16_9HELO|nr:uncharacterized protein PAC_03335 [Phialocephala subalpina]